MISIIVPVYNVEKELSRCIDSIVGQTYKDIEIILVNDGSTDSSLKICRDYEKKDSRISVIDKENGGLSDARNCGIDASDGDYILFVDSDDYIEKDACERLLNGMISDEVDFVVGALREVRVCSEAYQKHSNLKSGNIYNSRDFIIKSIKKNEWYAPAVLNLYRRDFIEKNELRFKVGIYYEDMEILPKMYLTAQKICYIDNCFYDYVIRDGSITSSTNNKKTGDALQIYSEWKKIFDGIEDKKLQKYLYGYLVKCYLKSCRIHKITNWNVQGMTANFSWKYSLSMKERFKVLLFSIAPEIYVKL